MIAPSPPILQPASFRITPSRAPSPWPGKWDEGACYSRQQLAAMTRLGLDPDAVEAIRVKRSASSAETWFPTGDYAPVHEYDCPILSRRKDGKLQILGPAGVPATVAADGWVKRPKEHRGWGRPPQ